MERSLKYFKGSGKKTTSSSAHIVTARIWRRFFPRRLFPLKISPVRGPGHGVAREESPATIPSAVVKTNHKNKEEKSCHEATVRDPLAGAAEEQAGEEEWVEAEELEGGGWAAPDRALAQPENVSAPNAALLSPIKSGYLATRYSALSVAQLWSENSNIPMTASQSRVCGKHVR